MGIRLLVAQAAQDGETVHFGQTDVAHDQIEDLAIQALHGFVAISGKRHAMAEIPQRLAEWQPNVCLVVHQEYVEHVLDPG